MENNTNLENMASSKKLLDYVKNIGIDRSALDNSVSRLDGKRHDRKSFYDMSVFDYQNNCLIHIAYSKANKPKEIYVDNIANENAVISKIEEHLNNCKIVGSRIKRTVLFSSKRVEHQIRFEDRFQILPMIPGSAIHDNVNVNVDEPRHPFILELNVPVCIDEIQTAYKSTALLNETVLLLSALTNGSVFDSNKFIKGEWLTPHGSDPIYKQTGYHFTFPKSLSSETFSENEDIPFNYQRPDDERYEALNWSDENYDHLKLFYGLSEQEKQKFLIAAYWIKHAHQNRTQSCSSSYVAIASAFEALSGVNDELENCGECKQVKGSGARFRKTVSTLLRYDKDTINKLYSLRSEYAHGSALALFDIEGFFLADKGHESEFITLLNLINNSQSALLTWLDPKVRKDL